MNVNTVYKFQDGKTFYVCENEKHQEYSTYTRVHHHFEYDDNIGMECIPFRHGVGCMICSAGAKSFAPLDWIMTHWFNNVLTDEERRAVFEENRGW